jgi:hypothetical protein
MELLLGSPELGVHSLNAWNIQPGFKLSVMKNGAGDGTVTSIPAGIQCGVGCTSQSFSFASASIVQLAVTAMQGSVFLGWGGDCSSGASNTPTQVSVTADLNCTASFGAGTELTVEKSGSGTGTVTSIPTGINCGPTCSTQTAPLSGNVQLTATAASGSIFGGWGGDCTGMGVTTTISVTATKSCTATFGLSLPAVRLNPFGNQTGTGPYNIEVANSNLVLTPAPGNITVTLLREVISQCSGLLFSSNRTVIVPQGQSSTSYNFNAGHDPACNTLPITTRYTVTQAVLAPSTVLDLSIVPAQRLVLSVTF